MRLIQSGHVSAKYLIVGEAPGEEEDQFGRPLIGASGQECYRMLEEARWLPPGSAKRINHSLGTYYDNHRVHIAPNSFLTLDKILYEANIFLTNVCHVRPPGNKIDLFFHKKLAAKKLGIGEVLGRYPNEHISAGLAQLAADIEEIEPQFILAFGDSAMWALTGREGITKWRGSILPSHTGIKVIPTFHPAYILRDWGLRAIALQDIRKAQREREFPEIRTRTQHFVIKPSYAESLEWLTEQSRPEAVGTPLVGDIETPHGWRDLPGHIACIGFAPSSTDAICIPLMCVDDLEGFYTPDQETNIVIGIERLMTQRAMIFHKGIFEQQHFARQWGFLANWSDDTMIMQHVAFPGLLGGKIDPITGKTSKKGSSLSLAFISSIYADNYCHWKDDGRDWNRKDIPDELGWWHYNCLDTTYTFEDFEKLRDILRKLGLWVQYRFMMDLAAPVLDMMLRGFPVDKDARRDFRDNGWWNDVNDEATFIASVRQQQKDIQTWLNAVCGFDLNTGSTPQMKNLFYDDLRVKKIYKGRGDKRRETLDEKALAVIANSNPLLAPICNAIIDERSLGHFDEGVLAARACEDGRMRCEINIPGTETLRFTTTKSPFNDAMNMQNINRMPEE